MKKCKQNKTKRKEKKNELFQESSTVHPLYWRNSIRYVRICPIWNKYFFKTLPVELPQARAVPETFSCLDKTAGYFFIVKTTQRKLHLSTGKNYHLTRRQLTRNKPVQWVFIISHWFLHGTWLLLYKTSQQSLPVLFQLSACQCCSEPVEGTKMIINILTSKRATAKFSHAQPSQNARNRWLQGTGASSRYLLFFQKKKKLINVFRINWIPKLTRSRFVV